MTSPDEMIAEATGRTFQAICRLRPDLLHDRYLQRDLSEIVGATHATIALAIAGAVEKITARMAQAQDEQELPPEEVLKRKIDRLTEISRVTELMLSNETQKLLRSLPEERRDELRAYGKSRLVALGWPDKATRGPDSGRTVARGADHAERRQSQPVAPTVAPADDPEAYLKRLDRELGQITNPDELPDAWERLAPDHVLDTLFPPDKEEALGIYRRHERRLEP